MSDITFDHVGKIFPRDGGYLPALENVSFVVGEREFVAILGPSGCGKTTLLRIAAGLERPSSGSVRVGGHPIVRPGPDRAMVFQQFALFPWKTVRENIAFGLKCKNVSKSEQNCVVERYLKLLGMSGTEESYPHELSGGMQQRVALARSYAVDPEVLLMDEPFAALDAQTRAMMQEELIRISRVNPRTVLFVTHSVEEAVYLADRIVVLSQSPASVVEMIDVRRVREAEKWEKYASEDVIEIPSFVHLRTQIRKLLRHRAEKNYPIIPKIN
jgi:NitT/TauT family transport system ATP-binding protein